MLKLTDIKKDALLKGIVPSQAVKVMSVDAIGGGNGPRLTWDYRHDAIPIYASWLHALQVQLCQPELDQ